MFSTDDIMTGELTATDVETGESESFVWSVYLDEDTLEIQSNKTIVLKPAIYRFHLTLEKENRTYFGEAITEISDGDQKTIALSIRPVIGSTTVNADVTSILAGFTL